MSDLRGHCKECREKLGKDWDVVHHWLDEFAKAQFAGGMAIHRVHRHHQAGVEEVRKKWGEQAAEAAKLHILDDFKELEWEHIPSRKEVEDLFGV